jgi:hypothetical protein
MASSRTPGLRRTTINGTVEAVELVDGSEGIVVTDGSDDFVVVLDSRGKKLLDHLDEAVEVFGSVARTGDVLSIKVLGCRFLGDFADGVTERFAE